MLTLWRRWGYIVVLICSVLFLIACSVFGLVSAKPLTTRDALDRLDRIDRNDRAARVELEDAEDPDAFVPRMGTGRWRMENVTRFAVERLFQRPFPTRRPEFLTNPKTGRPLECDMFNDDVKLCVERNGEQHYTFTPSFHDSVDKFEDQLFRDEVKARLLEENGFVLIVVPYNVDAADMAEYIEAEVRKYPELVKMLPENTKPGRRVYRPPPAKPPPGLAGIYKNMRSG